MRKYLEYSGWAGLTAVFAALTIFMIRTVWGTASYICAAAGLVLMVFWAVTHLEDIKKLYGLRQTRYGANVTVVVLTVIAILGVVNYLGAQYHKRWDTTSSKQFSVSDQTIKILEGLTDDVKVTVFDKDTSPTHFQLDNLLKIYRYHSNRFNYEFVDPDKNPGITQNYGVTTYGTVVLEHGDKMEKITSSEEQDLTNALIKVLKEQKQTIYFIVGHAEKDIADTNPRGYSKIDQGLKDQNYEVKTLNLLTDEKVPDDCNVLVVAGPEKAYQSFELRAIESYLRRGGKALILLDPETDSGVETILTDFNVKANDDVVVDLSGMGRLFGADQFMPVAMEYGYHTITSDFRPATLFPYCRSVQTVESTLPGVTTSELVKTAARGWAESEPDKSPIEFDENKDKQGPITISMAAESDVADSLKPATPEADEGELKSRLVVVGDSEFAANAYVEFSGNRDLFLNMVSWLAEMEDLISIRPKNPEDRRVNLTTSQVGLVRLISLLFLPLAAVAAGTVVWWRRRGRAKSK